MLGLTIRMNAARDDITTDDGQVIDRSKLTRPETRKITRMVRDIWIANNTKKDGTKC